MNDVRDCGFHSAVSKKNSRQGGATPESCGRVGRPRWTRGRSDQESSQKAQKVARERPIAELVKECKDFIERSTRRVNKLKAELESETGLLEEGRVRLARLIAQQATPVAEPVAGCGPSSTLQQMVNQLQLERDSLSQCQCNSPSARSLPGLEEWLNLRNCELRDALGSPDVIARLSHLWSQGASQLVVLRQGIGAQDAVRWKFTQRHGCPF